MKFLFIVQGEGRGHLTQAISLESILRNNGHEVVEILVGKSPVRRLPGFFNRQIHAPVKQFISPNFLPTASNKQANLTRSVIYNLSKIRNYWNSIKFINQRIRETDADVVINFYELLTGLTYLFFKPNTPQICIGHQYLFLHKDFKFPQTEPVSLFMLKLFTRITAIGAKEHLALSFREMKADLKQNIRVVPPLLRKEVFQQQVTHGDYIHGYMVNAGFAEDVKKWHQDHLNIPLRFFWDRHEEESVKIIDDTLRFYQIDDREFLHQMAGCKAYATTAGFESVCEAMYFGKPILMVPAHIEQICNAFDASRCGAGIIDSDFNLSNLVYFCKKHKPDPKFKQWVLSAPYRIVNELEKANMQNWTTEQILVQKHFA